MTPAPIGTGLQKKVLLRVFGLLFLLIVSVCLSMGAFSLREHRQITKAHFRAQALFLADQTERLVLWDDRVAIKALLSGLVDDQPIIAYAFVERDGRPYVHTFDRGVPRGLLSLHGPLSEAPSVKDLVDERDRVIFDVAAVVGSNLAILHLGLSRSAIDLDAKPEFVTVAILGVIAVIIGGLLAAVTARLITREVDGMTEVLRAGEERFRAVMDNLPAAVHLKDADGRFLLVNRRFEEWHAITLDDIRGSTASDVLPGAIADIHRAHDGQVTENRTVQKNEAEVDHPDGYRRTTMEIGFPILGARESVDGIGGISIDVTDHKHAEDERADLEQQLFHAQKMEALGRLAGGVAHDFNNLLVPIILITEVLLSDTVADSPKARHLRNVVSAARRARKLVNQILAYSRPDADEKEWLDLARVTSDAADLLSSTIPSFIKVTRSIAPDIPAVFADASQINQVIMNLGMNANHAIGMKNGELTVSLDTVFIDRGRPLTHGRVHKGHYVVLRIADTGCGMDQATCERIFEPFFSTHIGTEGTGLGLAVVHRIVIDHGGAIALTSAPGKGSTFEIFLPTDTASGAEE